jgi:hypothetical protein
VNITKYITEDHYILREHYKINNRTYHEKNKHEKIINKDKIGKKHPIENVKTKEKNLLSTYYSSLCTYRCLCLLPRAIARGSTQFL